MTDDTQPEAREFTMSQYASKDDMIGAMRKRIAELESELEAVGAGGVSGPLVGRASLSANAGEPVAWQYRSLRDNGAWFDCTKERFEMRCTQPEIWETRALYAASPTAQAEGWRLVPVEPTTDQEWAGKQAVLRGLTMAAACKIYKAMLAAAPLPPTSAEGVEHGQARQPEQLRDLQTQAEPGRRALLHVPV